MGSKKRLTCPVCGFRTLMVVNAHKHFELIPEIEMPKDWNADTYEKCRKCKSEIAVRLRK